MLVFYFWDDLGKKLKFSQYNDNTFNINNLNVNSDSGSAPDDFDTPMDHISKESREEMRWKNKIFVQDATKSVILTKPLV